VWRHLPLSSSPLLPPPSRLLSPLFVALLSVLLSPLFVERPSVAR
jgi:hypothetical protein